VSGFYLGDFTTNRAHAEQALALHDPAHAHGWITHPRIVALTFLFRSLIYLGYLDQARLRRDEAVTQTRQRTDAHNLATLLVITLACDTHLQYEPAVLLQQAQELTALCTEHGFPHWALVATLWRGWCQSASGCTEEGLALLTGALLKLRSTGAFAAMPSYLILLAGAFGNAGRPREGLKQLDEAASQMERTQERWAEADLHRARGELLVTVGDLVAAESSFQQSIAVARRQNAKLWELLAAFSLARLWRDQGKRTEARNLLAPVYNWFSEGFDTPVLQEARTLLDELQ
jgi:predicted ATPase